MILYETIIKFSSFGNVILNAQRTFQRKFLLIKVAIWKLSIHLAINCVFFFFFTSCSSSFNYFVMLLKCIQSSMIKLYYLVYFKGYPVSKTMSLQHHCNYGIGSAIRLLLLLQYVLRSSLTINNKPTKLIIYIFYDNVIHFAFVLQLLLFFVAMGQLF